MIRGVLRRLRRWRLPLLLVLLALSGAGGAQAWGQDGSSDIVIDDPRITESSGLAYAPSADLLYTVNDSGNEPLVYAVDPASGDVVGTTALAGVDTESDDLEAIALAGDGQLWLADIGDNGTDRSDVALYTLPAPGRVVGSATPRRYPLRYAGGPADVEALLVDPVGGTSWLVTKEVFGGQVLRLPQRLSPGRPVTPQPVPGTDIPGLVTDGTVLPDGTAVVLRTYGTAYAYRLPDWTLAGSFPLPRQQQGESLTALSQTLLLAGSEGTPALIDEVPVPSEVTAALARDGGPASTLPSDRPPATAEPAAAGASDSTRQVLLVAGPVAAALLVLAGVLLVRRVHRRA